MKTLLFEQLNFLKKISLFYRDTVSINISFKYFTLMTYDLGPLSFGILSISFSLKVEVANIAMLKVFVLLQEFGSNEFFSGC